MKAARAVIFSYHERCVAVFLTELNVPSEV